MKKLLLILGFMFAGVSQGSVLIYPSPHFGIEANSYSPVNLLGGLTITGVLTHRGATILSLTPRVELGPLSKGYTLKLTGSHMSDYLMFPALSFRTSRYRDYDDKGKGSAQAIGFDHGFSFYVGRIETVREKVTKKDIFFSIGLAY